MKTTLDNQFNPGNLPSFRVNDVEIFLDEPNRVIGCLVHLKIPAPLMRNADVQEWIAKKVHKTMQYLDKEGFLAGGSSTWFLNINGVFE